MSVEIQKHRTGVNDLRDCTFAQLFGDAEDERFTDDRLSCFFDSPTTHKQVTLSIPIYQRSYCWNPAMVARLLTDIRDAWKQKRSYYPIGTIVLASQKHSSRVLNIVDGQQRLVTLMLLLSVFRHIAPKEADKQVITNWLTALFDHFLDPFDLSYHFTNDCCFDYLQDERSVVELLSANVRISAEILKGMDAKSSKNLAFYTYYNCRFLVHYTDDVDSAYQFFTSVNVHGIPLTPVEYLKAVTFGKFACSGGKDKKKVQLWMNAEKRLGNAANFSELIGHIHSIEMARRGLKERFLTSIPSSSGNDYTLLETLNASDLISKVNTYSMLWRSIMEPGNNDWAEIQKNKSRLHLKAFITTGTLWRTWLTIALAAGQCNVSLLQKAEFWNRLEKLIAILFVRDKRTNRSKQSNVDNLPSRLYGILKTVMAANNEQKVYKALEPSQNEKSVFFARVNGNIYRRAGMLATQYILRRLNSEISSTQATFHWDKVRIEHIYPVNPGSAWKFVDFKKGNTNRLGNLCLLSENTNTQCSNAPWATKRGIYSDNQQGEMVPFALTSKALQYEEWNTQVFEKRHAELLTLIKKVYKVQSPKLSVNKDTGSSEEFAHGNGGIPNDKTPVEDGGKCLNCSAIDNSSRMTADDRYVLLEYSHDVEDGDDVPNDEMKQSSRASKVRMKDAPAGLVTSTGQASFSTLFSECLVCRISFKVQSCHNPSYIE